MAESAFGWLSAIVVLLGSVVVWLSAGARVQEGARARRAGFNTMVVGIMLTMLNTCYLWDPPCDHVIHAIHQHGSHVMPCKVMPYNPSW
jgi:glycine cleavage system protein P-like pyridoxal-binding family